MGNDTPTDDRDPLGEEGAQLKQWLAALMAAADAIARYRDRRAKQDRAAALTRTAMDSWEQELRKRDEDLKEEKLKLDERERQLHRRERELAVREGRLRAAEQEAEARAVHCPPPPMTPAAKPNGTMPAKSPPPPNKDTGLDLVSCGASGMQNGTAPPTAIYGLVDSGNDGPPPGRTPATPKPRGPAATPKQVNYERRGLGRAAPPPFADPPLPPAKKQRVAEGSDPPPHQRGTAPPPDAPPPSAAMAPPSAARGGGAVGEPCHRPAAATPAAAEAARVGKPSPALRPTTAEPIPKPAAAKQKEKQKEPKRKRQAPAREPSPELPVVHVPSPAAPPPAHLLWTAEQLQIKENFVEHLKNKLRECTGSDPEWDDKASNCAQAIADALPSDFAKAQEKIRFLKPKLHKDMCWELLMGEIAATPQRLLQMTARELMPESVAQRREEARNRNMPVDNSTGSMRNLRNEICLQTRGQPWDQCTQASTVDPNE